jgi:cellulose synthase/poly-beta-1,6-N-acetylglucosamine synthase-like glycosyltransferase
LLLIEVSAAFYFDRRPRAEPALMSRPTVAVVVPAHNESAGILSTLSDVKAQLNSSDRILVVADNCSDDTAIVAASAGVEVCERDDASKIGKGYALDWGIRHLKQSPPDIVIFIDADCRLAENAIAELVLACVRTSRPIQSLYLMTAPKDSEINQQVAEFAWRVKNHVRPLGLLVLNLSCQLMGTGMAFPWRVISDAHLASSEIVEDINLGLQLAQAGYPPHFCPSARLCSVFPSSSAGAQAQRQRWEHGHIITIARSAPQFLLRAIKNCDLNLTAMTLDMMIPPLSLLSLLLLAGMLLGIILFGFGPSSFPLFLSIANVAAFGLSMLLCWLMAGTDILPLVAMPRIGTYVLRKLPLYRRVFSGNAVAKWIRAERNGSSSHDLD